MAFQLLWIMKKEIVSTVYISIPIRRSNSLFFLSTFTFYLSIAGFIFIIIIMRIHFAIAQFEEICWNVAQNWPEAN